jgi:RHS repeat-associated protein
MKRVIIILTTFLLLTQGLLAGIEKYSTRLEGPDIFTGQTFEVIDYHYYTMLANPFWNNDFKNKFVKNWVKIGTNQKIPQDNYHQGDVQLKIDYLTWNPTTLSFVSNSVVKILGLSHDGTNGYTVALDESTFSFDNAYQIMVTIENINNLDPNYFFIESGIEVDRYYNPDSSPPNNLNKVLTQEDIIVHWNSVLGADYYELEYVHINNYTELNGVAGSPISASNLNFNFYLNSTRVQSLDHFYQIPNIFNKGYFLYRIRAVFKPLSGTNELVYSDWTGPEQGFITNLSSQHYFNIVTEYPFSGNWNHNSAFVEKGKRFDQISYSDGMGKVHQSQVLNPETKQRIVNNVYFDPIGRPVVFDLPTPENTYSLEFQPNFNLANINGHPNFNHNYFDQSGNLCDEPANGFWDQSPSGAARYYSFNNSNIDGENNNIPNGENYPYTRVGFTPDFTGRVSRTNGAGIEFRRNGGHENEFYYVSPNQTELNTLFGIESGKASHYTKVVTKDPNGQYYIKYMDMAGRTIVTYLEGSSPQSLITLEDNLLSNSNVSILEVNGDQNIDPSIPKAEINYTQFIANTDNYTLNYGFTQQQYNSICATGSPICFDCEYTLSINITGTCSGFEYSSGDISISGGTFDAICNQPGFTPMSVALALEEDVYHIQKVLTVNQGPIQDYWCYFVNDNNCITSVSDHFNPMYAAEPFEECDPNDNLITETSGTDCSDMRKIMQRDFSPKGQYAKYTQTGSNYSASDVWSIFNSGNAFGVSWQNTSLFQYLDASGTDITSSVVVSMSAFINNFRFEWTEQFLPYHPEYCRLEFCESNAASQAYDQLMLSTYEYNNAATIEGLVQPVAYIFPSNLTPFVYPGPLTQTQDPFFQTTGTAYANAMIAEMNNYITIGGVDLSMWEYAAYLAKGCDLELIDYSCLERPTDPCELDKMWVTFRGFYLSSKQNYYELAALDYAANNCPMSLCVGVIPSPSGCTGNYALLGNKVARWFNPMSFGDLSGITTTELQIIQNNAMTQGCESICDEYAEEWIASLSGCDMSMLDQSQIDNMKMDFANLCKTGCNTSEAVPTTTAATFPPPGGFYTIKDILNQYLGPGHENVNCSELLISSPKPYVSAQNQLNSLIPKLDTCACNVLYEAKENYLEDLSLGILPPNVINLETYLVSNNIATFDDVDYIMCSCDEFRNGNNTGWQSNANNDLIALNIQLADAISCESTHFIGCSELESEMDNLMTRFGNANTGPQITTIEELLAQPNFAIISNTYLNNLFGFNLSLNAYIDFYYKCHATTANPYCYQNPILNSWTKMLSLLAIKGELTHGNTLNLYNENIVYAKSNLPSYLGNTLNVSISGNSMTLNFTDISSNSCVITLVKPSSFTFGFDKIVGFESVSANIASCATPSSIFDLKAVYFDCGVKQIVDIQATSSCFQSGTCVCNPNNLSLCSNSESSNPNDILWDCYEPYLSQMMQMAYEKYQQGIIDAYADFKLDYNTKCSAAFETEYMNLNGPFNRYQYTMFYYDQAGNLERTVAPEGVHQLSEVNSTTVNTDRAAVVNVGSFPPASASNKPVHDIITSYNYNSYNQLVSTSNPDQDGATKYWYDRFGRIVASQNPVQADANLYSYIYYDNQARPYQVGQVYKTSGLTESIVKNPSNSSGSFWYWVQTGTKSEVTVTHYDKSFSVNIPVKFANGLQENLRLRVASVFYYEIYNASNLNAYSSATHYSYDIHGNVKEFIQDTPQLDIVDQQDKSTQYEYELVSGNVNTVHYQKDQRDQLTHEYKYDKLNRLTQVYTATDKVYKSRQAHYFYYDYGPLARIEYGQQKVQGSDFAYTINGWMKSLNSSTLYTDRDMGKDGDYNYFASLPSVHRLIANDVLANSLSYYESDYFPIGGQNSIVNSGGSPFETDLPGLFNGNIRSFTNSIYGMQPMGNRYQYDQLNRLIDMTAFYSDNDLNDNDWASGQQLDQYFNSYSYDRNGNILSLVRFGPNQGEDKMDDLSYDYPVNSWNGQRTNRLDFVNENAGSPPNDTYDDYALINPASFVYDKIGQLISDENEGIHVMEWRKGDKKLKRIERSDSDSPEISFEYNPFGQRTLKIVKPRIGGNIVQDDLWEYTYYAYDANGQVMSVYKLELGSSTEHTVTLDEQHHYGASRLGMKKPALLLFQNGPVIPPPTDIYRLNSGMTFYELKNYLGNVNVVITDRRFANLSGPLGLEYTAIVVSTADYYPFGMPMPQRTTDLGTYRYAYNGMELDNEVSGTGNSYTTEFRQYDPRLGRWKSLDPLMAKFPWMSPYVAFDNNPVFYVDPYGLESVNSDGEPEKKEEGGKTENNGDIAGNGGGEKYIGSDGKEYITTHSGGDGGAKKIEPKPTNTASHSSSSASKQELSEIHNRGFSDAMYNANSFGVTDLLNVTDNARDYGTKETRTTYLQGRLAGNTAAIVQGLAEADAGGTAAAGGLAGGPVGAATVSMAGLVVAGHGSGVVAVATADQIETSLALSRLNSMNGGSGKGSGGIGKNSKKASEEQIESLLGKNWHQNGSKTKFIKKYLKQLKGSTNADFYIDQVTKEVLLLGNKSKTWVKTGKFIN